MAKRRNKNYIHVASLDEHGEIMATEEAIEASEAPVEKEGKKMGFFAKNKGLIIGGIAAVAAGAAGFFVGKKFGGSEEDIDCPLLIDEDDEDEDCLLQQFSEASEAAEE